MAILRAEIPSLGPSKQGQQFKDLVPTKYPIYQIFLSQKQSKPEAAAKVQ